MDKDYLKIIAYVNAAANLAESVEADIKSKKREISSSTVVKLGKFASAAHQIQSLLDTVEQHGAKLQ